MDRCQQVHVRQPHVKRDDARRVPRPLGKHEQRHVCEMQGLGTSHTPCGGPQGRRAARGRSRHAGPGQRESQAPQQDYTKLSTRNHQAGWGRHQARLGRPVRHPRPRRRIPGRGGSQQHAFAATLAEPEAPGAQAPGRGCRLRVVTSHAPLAGNPPKMPSSRHHDQPWQAVLQESSLRAAVGWPGPGARRGMPRCRHHDRWHTRCGEHPLLGDMIKSSDCVGG